MLLFKLNYWDQLDWFVTVLFDWSIKTILYGDIKIEIKICNAHVVPIPRKKLVAHVYCIYYIKMFIF